MKRARKIQWFVLLALIAAAVGFVVLRPPGPMTFADGTRVDIAQYREAAPSGVPASLAQADVVTRGEYLARAADCVACHTAPGGKPFAGGLAFELPPFGTLYSSNITPDRETGIGNWTNEEFVKALHEGVGKGGKHIYPAFPYTAYTLMTRDDVLAIKAYLFSLEPVRQAPPRLDMVFPFNQRYLMWFWNLLYNPGERFQPIVEQTATWNRGAYLTEALGHCGECHTPRTLLQGLDAGEKLGGAIIRGWKAYNLTSDEQSGIGAWSEDELAEYLSTGHAAGRGTAAGPMAEALDHSLRYLTDDDIRAMAAYLKTIPPIREHDAPAVKREPPSTATATAMTQHDEDGPGKRVFQGACASCHHWDGSGVQSPYAALTGIRAVNDPDAVNLTQVVLHGTRLHSALGEQFMPAFGAGYSDAEIAALANYMTGRFGAQASAITSAEIAERR